MIPSLQLFFTKKKFIYGVPFKIIKFPYVDSSKNQNLIINVTLKNISFQGDLLEILFKQAYSQLFSQYQMIFFKECLIIV